jgi:sugar fermentation stimulation protein A
MNNLLPEFRGSSLKKREPTYRDSRFDFHLSGFARDMLLEVKSCTLVQNSTALFPDAPTKRGTRHLKTLIEASNEFEVAILFIIQRNDSSRFKPNYITDPDFSNTLEKAFDRGVKVFAYDCNVTPSNIAINKRVPIQF